VEANILEFNDVVHSMLDDVPVNSETHVVTSPISRIAGSVFKDTHMSRVCVRAFIWVSVCAFVSV